jgi:tetratricopeptide (TPR) repeat protein
MTDKASNNMTQAEDPGSATGDVITISGNVVNSTIIIKSVVKDDEASNLEKQPPEAGDPPFQGLQYFDEKDAPNFFGREQLTAQVIGRLQRSRFLVVIGASGSGKSSLVRAGVIPALKAGQRLADGSQPPPGSPHWAYRTFTPGGHPLDALAASLARQDALPSQINDLRAELASTAGSLALAVQSLLAQEAKPRLLLVIDQLEEIFTQVRDPAERQAFIDCLVSTSNPDDSQPLSVILILRADFYAQVAQHDRLRELVSQHQEFIGAMSRAELVDAIIGPLNKGGWKIQEGLVKVILDDVGYEPGALPLLSHALLETWKRRRARTLTLSGYIDAGGVNGAIRETADTIFRQRLNPEQAKIARMIFLRLADLGEDAQDTRRRVPFDELITRSTDMRTIQVVINILADARLVTTSTVEPGDVNVIEIAHESLIREWPTLRQWLNADRQGLILHRQLTEAAEDWEKNERDTGLLFRGSRLEGAQEWASKPDNAEMLSKLEEEFLMASVENMRLEKNRELRLKRMQRIFVAVAAGLLVVIAALAYLGFLRPGPPPTMNGLYNVAIAGISEINPGGKVSAAAQGDTSVFSGQIYQSLQSALADNTNILIWRDSPELRRQAVKIDALESDTPDALAQSAARLAQRLNADMVIYGELDRRQQPPTLRVQLYLAPRLSDALNEIKGSFQLSQPIAITTTYQSPAVQSEIGRQATLMANLAVGQSESQLGHTLEALEAYLTAARLAPESDMVQFFIGREYLFSVEREPVLEVARPAFEQKAQESLDKALQLNPDNARAYIGLGSLHLKQARRLVEGASNSEMTAQDFAQASLLLDQADDAYSHVMKLPGDAAQYGAPVTDLASLGLGNARLLRGIALQLDGQSQPAAAAFQRAIQLLDQTLPAFQAPGLERYLAQNRQFLGNAYQWSGYQAELNGDTLTAEQAYQQAAEQLDACIALGNGSTDRIILSDIIADNCQPMRQQAGQHLQALSGGS